jgi:hypothetical protein
MAATTKLGSKPLKGARTFIPEVGLISPVSFELIASDSRSPKSGHSQAVTSESGRL